jgi:energy-coupling factor transporter ATP-binding protein EcfA2
MQLQKASRKKAKIKMCLNGPSGSGKTYSSLLIANGLCYDWSKTAVIDSENHSSELYSHLGSYNVLNLASYSPENYVKAIETCEQAGMEVIIIDSITHEWEFMLEAHASLPGNSFNNWQKIGLRHKQFIQAILGSKAHVIVTTRTKQDYVLNDRNGKMVPEKVGLKAVQREGLDYEFTLVFDLNMKNSATASKDRTGLFFGKPEQKLSIEIGRDIYNWCNAGLDYTPSDITQLIHSCNKIDELLELYNQYPQFKEVLRKEYENRKREILVQNQTV